MKAMIALVVMMTMSMALGGETKVYRVHFSLKGAGHDVTVFAESCADARTQVQLVYDGAVVTGCHEKKRMTAARE